MTKHPQLNSFIQSLDTMPRPPKVYMYKDGLTVSMMSNANELYLVFSDAEFCGNIKVFIDKMLKGQLKKNGK